MNNNISVELDKHNDESLTAVRTHSESDKFIQLEDKYGAKNYNPLDVVIEHGDGVWVFDVDGNKYLDCLSAYSAVSQGHCHPAIAQAAIDQMRRLTLISRAFRNDQMGPFLKELCDLIGYDLALLMNSGAEGVETAIKAVRKWGYVVKGVPANQAEIIVCQGNFHGRTTTIVGFSSEAKYKENFGPFTPGFITIPIWRWSRSRIGNHSQHSRFLIRTGPR